MRRKKNKQRPSRIEFENRCKFMVQDILSKISSNEFPEGSFLPSEQDLCTQYSLSRSSVRKVIEQLEKMVTLTRQQGKGIVVGNPIENKMGFNQMKKVMVFLPFGYKYETVSFSPESQVDSGNAIYALERELSAHEIGCSFVYYDTVENFDIQQTLQQALAEHINVFVIIGNAGEKIMDLCKMLAFHNIKIVSVLHSLNFPDCSIVDVNNFGIGQLAAKHLIELGHSNIACITSTKDSDWEAGRIKGFIDTCEGAGLGHCSDLIFKIPIPSELNRADNEFVYVGEQGAKMIQDQILMENPEITGIFCINDNAARGVYNFAKSKEICIPDTWSVIGCDNDISHLNLNLTTISQEFFQCGHMAAELIINLFMGKLNYTWPVNCKVPPILLKRGSTKAVKV